MSDYSEFNIRELKEERKSAQVRLEREEKIIARLDQQIAERERANAEKKIQAVA